MANTVKKTTRNIVIAGILAFPLQGIAQQKAPTTELGIQNPFTPESAKKVGARAVRVADVRLDLKSKKTEQLASYKQMGFTVVATMVCWEGKRQWTVLRSFSDLPAPRLIIALLRTSRL